MDDEMRSAILKKSIVMIVLSVAFHATSALANETIEIAAFLFFERCFPKQNFCGQINNQFPNVSLSLAKKSENDGFSVYAGAHTRTQKAFDHIYSQTMTVEKIEPKDGSQIRYHFSIIVLDENGNEVIHPYNVRVDGKIGALNQSITTGVSFDQPEWDSVVRPKFYLGQKFIQPPE